MLFAFTLNSEEFTASSTKCFVMYLGHTVSAKVFQSLLDIRKSGQLFHKCKKHLLGLQDSPVTAQLLAEVQVFEPAHN